MSVVVERDVTTTDGPTDTPKMVHVVCTCAPDRGMCGYPVPGPLLPDWTPIGCVVCAEMDPLPCPRCGV